MKKRLGAAVLAILMLGITGCGSAKQDTMGVLIPDQTFEVTLNDWGKVTFASYAPENGVYMADGQNPDVRFGLVQDDQTIYEFPGANEAYTSTDLFLAVSAISFKDYNDDGLQDVITICEYETMAGEGYQIARVYYQLEEKQGFVEDALLTQYLSEQRKTENIAAVLEMKEAYREYTDCLNGQQDLHAQLSVMAREKEVWAAQAEFANEICQYAVTDLDHNGRYEIIVANMGGTGMYTYSRFWEINEQCSGLTECETDFLEGDRYLICSDGLTDMINLAEMQEILEKKESVKETVEKLLEKALEAGGKDNITIVLCEVKELEQRTNLISWFKQILKIRNENEN